MEIIVRDATPQDVRAIREVYYKTWLATYPNEAHGILMSDIEDRYKNSFTPESIQEEETVIINLPPDERMLVALSDGKIVGTSKLKKGAERNEMHTIYILPEHQGKGLGKALFAESLAWFDASKDTQIDTAVYNYQAIKFYEGLGFVSTGETFTEEEFRMPSGGIIHEQRMVRKSHLAF